MVGWEGCVNGDIARNEAVGGAATAALASDRYVEEAFDGDQGSRVVRGYSLKAGIDLSLVAYG